MRQQRFALPSLVLLLALSRCTVATEYGHTVPEQINDGWETGSLGSVKMDADFVRDLCGRVVNGGYKSVQSVLVVKVGKLVIEE